MSNLVKKVLLIVEDNITIANQMSEILSPLVDESHFALNGEEGVEFLKNNSQVSCVISDIMMPRMNGVEFIKSIRGIEMDVPFIFFSTLGEEQMLKEVVPYGPIDYITKPDLESLYSALEQAFKSNFYKIEEDSSEELLLHLDKSLSNLLK